MATSRQYGQIFTAISVFVSLLNPPLAAAAQIRGTSDVLASELVEPSLGFLVLGPAGPVLNLNARDTLPEFHPSDVPDVVRRSAESLAGVLNYDTKCNRFFAVPPGGYVLLNSRTCPLLDHLVTARGDTLFRITMHGHFTLRLIDDAGLIHAENYGFRTIKEIGALVPFRGSCWFTKDGAVCGSP